MEGKLVVALVEEAMNDGEINDSLKYTTMDLYDHEELSTELETAKFDETFFSNDLFESEKTVRNLREKTAILINLLKPGFKISYDYPPRPKFEVFGGYKIAKQRQAHLAVDFSKVKIYNLYFRFFNEDLNNLTTSALMYVNNKEEVILLSPQNTQREIEALTNFYKNTSSSMVLKDQVMNPDEQSKLLENLRLLTVNERCAQSLQHEYGHILHWRLFKFLGLKEPFEIYEWFLKYGYPQLMDARSPEFRSADAYEKVYLLKECLAEDYRIWLNMINNNGMFILPNINTFYGDFITPNLLEDGVRLMKEMLTEVMDNSLQNDQTKKFSGEPNRILRGSEIYKKALSTNWKPNSSPMTEQEHLKVIEELKKGKPAGPKGEYRHMQVMEELKLYSLKESMAHQDILYVAQEDTNDESVNTKSRKTLYRV